MEVKETGRPEEEAGRKMGRSEVWDIDPSFTQEPSVTYLVGVMTQSTAPALGTAT